MVFLVYTFRVLYPSFIHEKLSLVRNLVHSLKRPNNHLSRVPNFFQGKSLLTEINVQTSKRNLNIGLIDQQFKRVE